MNSKETNLLDEVENFTGKILNSKDDLVWLYNLSVESGNEKEFEEVAFTGKYLYGLMRVMKSGVSIPEVESLEHVRKDISKNMELIIEQLGQIVTGSDTAAKSYFENKYLQLSQQSIVHLNLLIEDLDLVKKYLNYKKRNA
ncbi:MAG TPA: hypothetical protein VH917_02490 [Ignavibacteriaceae bacterium]|jgi:hypothetical protein